MVSIIIPHFNRLSFLKQTIESVRKQTLTDWEIIIVDDQSDVDVWKELQEWSTERIFVYQRMNRAKGPSACRNIGAEKAKGKFLLFLDSDDLLSPFCLEQRVKAMDENPEVEAGVYLMQEFLDSPGDRQNIFNRILAPSEWISFFFKNENPWNVTCPLWRKKAFETTGGFDESFLFMEDPDLHLRALQSGIGFKTFYDLPADCFYRVNHIDDTKTDFYYNSILYRIKFYQKLTSGIYSQVFVKSHKISIKTGVRNLVKTFLYSRVNQFPELYEELIKWMGSTGVFSRYEIMRYRFLMKAGNSESKFLKAMKVKGVCWRMV